MDQQGLELWPLRKMLDVLGESFGDTWTPVYLRTPAGTEVPIVGVSVMDGKVYINIAKD